MSWIAESRQSQIRRETDQPFPNSMRRADALSVFTNRPGISIMDNLSVFFLAEHEQSADDVMARLAAFIRGAKQTLDFASYDMRFSDSLRAQLAAALREKAE